MLTKIAALLAITFVLASSCADASNTDDTKLFNEGIRLRDLGNNTEAAKIFREVQRRRPNDANVLTELADSYLNNYSDITYGPEKGEKCLLRAIQLDPELGRAYMLLAKFYNASGDFDEGIKLSTKAMTVKKPDWEALRERAAALSNMKQDQAALVDIELHMKKRPPASRKTRQLRATILENLKNYDRALSEYRTLLKENFEDTIAYREFSCLRKMNKPDEALKAVNNLLAHNSKDDVAYLNRARLFESIGKHRDAISDYTKTIELQPAPSVLKERAAVFEKMGRKDLAEKDRKEAENLAKSENY